MKRHTAYFAALALLFSAASCGRGGLDIDSPAGLSVRVETAPYTKGGEFSGTALTSGAKLFLLASQRNADGTLSRASLFRDGDSPKAQPMVKDGSVWKPDGEVYFPLGGGSIDALLFGADIDSSTVPAGFGSGTCWAPSLNADDAASGVRFKNVNTYDNQYDLMYGVANGITASAPQPSVSLSHAMAQLVFNVKFENNPAMAFIETNETYYKFKLDDILFLSDAGFTQYVANPASVTAPNVLLKTRGTFTVDNDRNTLMAAWSGLEGQAGAYKVRMDAVPAARSQSNTVAESTPVFDNTESGWKQDGILRNKIYQAGHPLLVPEQPACNMTVVYTYDNIRYHGVLNVPQGSWEAGNKYIYTLVFTEIKGGIGLKLELNGIVVADWDDSPSTYTSNTLETRLSIDVPQYVRYIPSDDENDWTGSYVAIADGTDGSGGLRSPRLHLVTTSSSGMELVSDNENVCFLRYTPAVGVAASSEARLGIPAGTDVDTMFYVVPASGTVPTFDNARKANVYLHDLGGNMYVPYNVSALPGASTNSSVQFYIVSATSYDAPVAITTPFTPSPEHLYKQKK
ncbi:MAG: fimbrillin family protein [Bacteroidales bacterium]|nr:fimbrillin family protein [Bacteroidales bacterium]